ncbi:hypothetical protein BC832DRAFT_566759 [Gaertneriomyces semiglobifer]|nr:hypothetical protein BC832DRAFT_566759 [Gaertneriomyces semiglobifer]
MVVSLLCFFFVFACLSSILLLLLPFPTFRLFYFMIFCFCDSAQENPLPSAYSFVKSLSFPPTPSTSFSHHRDSPVIKKADAHSR